jgi:hypothetical protein
LEKKQEKVRPSLLKPKRSGKHNYWFYTFENFYFGIKRVILNVQGCKCIINGKCKNGCYEEGDNDLYWLNCKNGNFYVIPECVLIDKEFVGKNCNKEKLYTSLTNANTEWCNKYLFNYDNLDKDRLLNLINKC